MNPANLKDAATHFSEKLKKIKVALFDLDGILTDGQLIWVGEEVGWTRKFNAIDGYGMKVLMEAGLKVGVITGGNSKSVIERFEVNLPIDYVYAGNEDKRQAYLDIQSKGFKDEEILYMGDEFFDLPLLKRAGFSATVPHASIEIQDVVDYVTTRDGGYGAAREVIDMLRFVQGIVPEVPDFENA